MYPSENLYTDHSHPHYLMREFFRAHRLAMMAIFERLELHDPGQPVMLLILEQKLIHNQLPTQRELALEMHLSPPTVNASVKSLERQGLVQKLPDAKDLRKTRIEITQAGLETAAACRNAFALLDEASLRDFTPEEAQALNGFIRRLADNLLAEAGGKETDAL